jgi:dihydrofolate reductase
MRKVIAAINMSLDGFCDHTLAIADEEIHNHYRDLLNDTHAILYGRKTYELMQYWQGLIKNPSGEKSMDEFALAIDRVPKIVFSKSLQSVDWVTASMSSRSPNEEVQALKQGGDENSKAILIGSRSLIIQLLNLQLVDELQICIHPVIAVGKLPLFENIEKRTILTLVKTKTFSGGHVIHYYEPSRT